MYVSEMCGQDTLWSVWTGRRFGHGKISVRYPKNLDSNSYIARRSPKLYTDKNISNLSFIEKKGFSKGSRKG